LCRPPSGERSQALSSAISIAAIVRRPNCSMFEISADSSLLGSTPFPGRLLQMLRSSFREASVRHRFKAVCIKRTVRRLNRRTTNPGGINDEQIGLDRTTLAALVCRIEGPEKSTRHLRKAKERHRRARGPINPLARASFKASPQNPPAAREIPRQFEA